MSRTVSVVAHTHWDREWYAPFETYRLRLLSMVDGLLELLERDARFGHFHLDGQVAVIDDYLALRPSASGHLGRLISEGRLAVGPWYVLMDEFCVSGETLIRNLQLGLDRAAALGAEPTVGYLPDMFGHVAQMPQILAAAGLPDAVVWRGVPAAVDRTGFWWEAPDGTGVRAEYLPVGYAGGAFLPSRAGDLVRRVAAHEEEIAAYLPPGWPMLLMNGGDHQNPQPWLPQVLEEANRSQDRFFFRQVSLREHLAAAPRDGLPRWVGELRSGHRAPILMGVLSNRVDVKQAAAETEELLEKRAEPLSALWLPAELWPAGIDRAWIEVIRNSAHDSVCACSADEVGRAVLGRYDTARALGHHAVEGAAAIAGVALSAPGPAVLNPLPFSRSGLVELLVAGTSVPPGAQQLEAVPAGERRMEGRGRDLAAILGRLAGEGWLGPSGRAVGATISPPGPGPLTLTLDHDATRSADRLLAPTMAEAWALAGAGADAPLTVVARRAAWQRILVRVPDVPGWGWSTWADQAPAVGGHGDRPGAPPTAAPVTVSTDGLAIGSGPDIGPVTVAPVAVGPVAVGNGLVAVEIDPATGTFSLDGVAGQNGLVEEGDAGDTYNFAPVPGSAAVTDPVEVRVEVLERGPLRAVIRVHRRFSWPAEVGFPCSGGPPARSPERVPTDVISDIEVRAGEAVVRVATRFENRCRDHRVRAVFPLARPAGASVAECAFATVRRGPDPEGGPMEAPVPAFPSRRFVTAGELTVTHSGLLEHQLVDGGRALALTLLRATGVISRPWLETRPNVAGPPTPAADAQMPGPVTARYALAPNCGDPFRLADEVWTPLVSFESSGQGHLPARGSRLELSAGRCVVSSLRRRGKALEVRVFNPSPSPSAVAIPGHRGWLVDLRGREISRWEDSFDVAPGGIATARLDALSLD